MKRTFFITALCLFLLSCQQQPLAKGPAPNPVEVIPLAEEMVASMAKGDFVAATKHFDDTMKNALSPTQIESIWKDHQKKFGEFQGRESVRTETWENYTIVFITCKFGEDNHYDYKLVFDGLKQVGGFFLVETADTTVVPQAQELIANAAKGDFAAASREFDEVMQEQFPVESFKAAWQQVVQDAGEFRQQVQVNTSAAKGYTSITVTCDFTKKSYRIIVSFNSKKQVSGIFFKPSKRPPYQAPAYVDTASFSEREVTVGSGEWALPGTLTIPKGDKPSPVVVLVHGSGPNDRDETIGPNKVFRDIAWGLASKGIAVLRYDKRTKVHGGKMIAIKDQLTLAEITVDDALLAVELLRKSSLEGIDSNKIYILGHSLGGTAMPRMGQRDAALAGLISLAGATRPLEDLTLEQVKYIFEQTGQMKTKEGQERLRELTEQVAKVKDPELTADTPAEQLPLGAWSAKFWLDMRSYSPAKVAKSLKQPLLILQGERDYQVTMEDFSLWQKHLANRPNATLKSYPKLNHLFIAGEGPSIPTEYTIIGHVDQEVVEDIARWIKKHQ